MQEQINALEKSLNQAKGYASKRENYVNSSQEVHEDHGRVRGSVRRREVPVGREWGQLSPVFDEHPENDREDSINALQQSIDRGQVGYGLSGMLSELSSCL